VYEEIKNLQVHIFGLHKSRGQENRKINSIFRKNHYNDPVIREKDEKMIEPQRKKQENQHTKNNHSITFLSEDWFSLF